MSKGPGAFHRHSLRRVFRECNSVTVITAAPYPQLYETAAMSALLNPGNPSVVIDCLPETQDAWIAEATRRGVLPCQIRILAASGYPPAGDCINVGTLPPLPAETMN